MTLTKTIHPPAGATALLAATDPQVVRLGWYLLPVVLLCTALLLITALTFNNIQRQYPTFWWTPVEVGQKRKLDDVEKSVLSSKSSLNMRFQQHEGGEGPVIKISRGGVIIPDCISVANEESDILQILHQRLGSEAL